MDCGEFQIRPETYALDALIRETVSRARRDVSASRADAMLFLGNWHHAFPALVVQDPVLEPVDKLVWMVIYQSGRGAGINSVFPSYRDIACMANVSSTSTVSRAIAILRATRWLSLCARGRDPSGRFRGNVYALHDEPLPLADALHLDSDYMAFLKDARRHHHARVRRVVAAVFASMDEEIQSGKDVLAPENVIERRLEAVRAIHQGGRRYFSFSTSVLSRLANTGAGRRDRVQDRNSKVVDEGARNSKWGPRSSKECLKTTTTTTTENDCPGVDSSLFDKLIFPTRLNDNQRALAIRYLAEVPDNQRQAVLDELEGRVRAEGQGAKPVYDELRYLHHLCVEVNRGGFHPNLGLKVQGERERRLRELQRTRKEAEARERESQEPASRPLGEGSLADIRKKLGMPALLAQRSC